MTGGDAGGPPRDGPPELSTDDAATDAPPGSGAARGHDGGRSPAGDAEPATDARSFSEDGPAIGPGDATPPRGTPAIDDPAGLPPIVEATSPHPTDVSPAPPAARPPTPPPARPTTPPTTPPPPIESSVRPAAVAAAAPDDDRDEPQLETRALATTPAKVTMAASPTSPAVPSGSAYRSTEERNRSVYRRANPWYRRLARGVIAASLIAALGGGVYLGARELQDYLDRDRLPSPGAEVPTIRETSFLVESTAAGVSLDGTLSIDVQTGAFEFVGSPGGPNAADRLTSPDGTTVYAQGSGSTWIELPAETPVVASVRRAVRLLSDDDTSDAILTSRIRRGYVDLVRQIEEGTGDNTRTRYDITLDLTPFAESFPLQWQSFQDDAIPGIRESRRHPLSFWLDDDDVLVQVTDEAAGWSWQRLTYSGSAFAPFVPAPNQIEQAAPAIDGTVPCTIAELDLTYATTLPTCDDAADVGRGLAVTAGVVDDVADPAAELAFVSVCGTMQGDEIVVYEFGTYLDLARLLDDTGVCPGDVDLVQIGKPGPDD